MMARTTKLVPPAKSWGGFVLADGGESEVPLLRVVLLTGKLVELEAEGYGEEEELVGDGDEQGDDEVVLVEDSDGAQHDGQA